MTTGTDEVNQWMKRNSNSWTAYANIATTETHKSHHKSLTNNTTCLTPIRAHDAAGQLESYKSFQNQNFQPVFLTLLLKRNQRV